MCGLNSKLQTMLITCTTATYNELISIAITTEEKNHQHKEVKKRKNVLAISSSNTSQRQRIVYQPIYHPPYHPPQQQSQQQSFVRPAAALSYPRQMNAPSIHPNNPQNNNYPCYNCGKTRHYSRDCPLPKQANAPRSPMNQQQNNQQNAQKKGPGPKSGRVHYIQAGAIPEGEPMMMGMFSVAKQPTVILFDSGASHTFINSAFVMKHQLSIEAMENSLCVQSPSG